MKMGESTFYRKSQVIYFPKAVVTVLSLRNGDLVAWYVEGKKIVLRNELSVQQRADAKFKGENDDARMYNEKRGLQTDQDQVDNLYSEKCLPRHICDKHERPR